MNRGGGCYRNLLTVAFEAHHAEVNHHRRYEITVGRHLLDDGTVSINYGRTGQRGQVKRFAGPCDDEMKAVIRDRLRRRLSVPKRIGCLYRITHLSTVSGFDAAAWLPDDVMARFF